VGDEDILGCNVRSIESGSRGLLGVRLFCQDGRRLECGARASPTRVGWCAFACHLEPVTAVPLAAGTWRVVLDVAVIRAVAADRGLCERLREWVNARRLEIDATWGLRQLAIHGDLRWRWCVDAGHDRCRQRARIRAPGDRPRGVCCVRRRGAAVAECWSTRLVRVMEAGGFDMQS
jgi:hypothetical protein